SPFAGGSLLSGLGNRLGTVRLQELPRVVLDLGGIHASPSLCARDIARAYGRCGSQGQGPFVRKSGRNDLISSHVINDDLAILRCSQSARLSSRMPTDFPHRMSMMKSATADACASGPTQRLAAVRPLSEAQRASGW